MVSKLKQFLEKINPDKFIWLIIFIFICSRIVIYHYLHLPVQQEINSEMHLLDPVTMRTNLLHGLYYLHTQPPLFNLFLGVLLKLNPYLSINFILPVINFCLGLFIALGSYKLLKILDASKSLAFVGALAVMFFPSLVQSERWLNYFSPLAALMLTGALLVYYFVKTRRLKYFSWFFLLMTVMVLTWGFFHLLFWLLSLMVLAIVLIYELKLPEKKKYFLVMGVFFLLSGGIYLRNYQMYGIFTSSTWQGMDLADTLKYVKTAELQKMIDKKIITPLALIPRFSAPEVYYAYYHLIPKTGNDVVDSLYKSTGSINYNNWIYPIASKEYQKNSLKIIEHYPLRYLTSAANEAYIFFGFFQYRNFNDFQSWGSVRVHSRLDRTFLYITAFPVPLAMLSLFSLVIYWLVKKIKAGVDFKYASPQQQAVYALMIFMFFAIVYVFCMSLVAEEGEANFFRIPIDPLFVSLAVLSLAGLLRPWLSRFGFFDPANKYPKIP